MKTRDAIETLSYFARKIDFAAGTKAEIEQGERIQIEARTVAIVSAACGLTGNTDPRTVLPQLEEKAISKGEICELSPKFETTTALIL